MNQPQTTPSFQPLIQWLEQNGIVKHGTSQQVSKLAEKVKGLGAALRAAGVKGA